MPQGSVLGISLFNILIHDCTFIEIESEICNFAGDTTIYACNASIGAVMIRLKGEMHRFMEWFTGNGMTANPSKFHYA